MKTAVTIIVPLLVLGTFLSALTAIARQPEARRDYIETVRALRWWMLPTAVAHLVCVVAIATVLMQIPGLSWGWWQLFGGSGNIALGQSSDPNVVTRMLAVALPLLVAVLAPLLARREEEAFRDRLLTAQRSTVVRGSVVFGLAHLIMGIPIAVGLALAGSGLLYAAVARAAYRKQKAEWLAEADADRDAWLIRYFEGNTLRHTEHRWARTSLDISAALHLASNWIVLTVFAVTLILV